MGAGEGLVDLARRRAAAESAGSARAVERQHAKGKLTARERVSLLLDPGSFMELDQHARSDAGGATETPPGDGVVTGRGTVDGRTVCVFAQDFTVLGGSLGKTVGLKIIKAMDLAIKIGCPIIGLNDSGGARIQEGVTALAWYAEIGRRNVRASGMVPQISLIMGPCAGGAAYSPALTDFTVMVQDTAHMFVTGPEVVRSVTGEQASFDELGGAEVNSAVAGNAHFVADDDADAIAWVQTLLSYLPSNMEDRPPVYAPTAPDAITDTDRELDHVVPDSLNQAYDMHEVIRRLVDEQEFLEIQPRFGRSVLCGFGRIDGHSVGIVANQPLDHAGTLNIDSSEKAARFVRFCDAFNIPVLTLVDVPGYMPGVEEERRGMIRRGAKLFYAYCEATVPTVTVVVRKAYGGGYGAMGSKHLGVDLNYAWPTAEIAVMGATAAVEILHGRELAQAADERSAGAIREELVQKYRQSYAHPYLAAEQGFIDDVIAPAQTRTVVANAFRVLRTKHVQLPPKKHGNIPL